MINDDTDTGAFRFSMFHAIVLVFTVMLLTIWLVFDETMTIYQDSRVPVIHDAAEYLLGLIFIPFLCLAVMGVTLAIITLWHFLTGDNS